MEIVQAILRGMSWKTWMQLAALFFCLQIGSAIASRISNRTDEAAHVGTGAIGTIGGAILGAYAMARKV